MEKRMKESFDKKFKNSTQSKEGQDEKIILVAARSKDADDVKMLARGSVGTGMGFPKLSVDPDINIVVVQRRPYNSPQNQP